MIAVTAILTVLAVWVALPAISDALAWMSALSARRKSPSATAQPVRLLFVVPAHDEEASIARCVTSLRSQDYDPERLTVIVIADNCTDATAARALAAGAEVLERSVPDRPGKNEALAWGFERLPLAEYDAVVIADADSVVAPDYAQRIAEVPNLRQTVGQTFDGTCQRVSTTSSRGPRVFPVTTL